MPFLRDRVSRGRRPAFRPRVFKCYMDLGLEFCSDKHQAPRCRAWLEGRKSCELQIDSSV